MVVFRQWFGQRDPADEHVPIVLLHEGLGSISTWGSFPTALATRSGHPVLAYDRRGYGRSDPAPGPWPVDFMHDEAAELADLLTDEGVENPLLVGHSDGATIALLYPYMRSRSGIDSMGPEPLGIVSMAAHLFVEPVCVAAIETMRDTYRTTLAQRLGVHHRDGDATFAAWSEVWLSARFRQWSIDDELAAVTCPVLAVQGRADSYATRSQLDRMEQAVSGPIELVDLPGCDHWPHREATEEMLTRIVTFLERLIRN